MLKFRFVIDLKQPIVFELEFFNLSLGVGITGIAGSTFDILFLTIAKVIEEHIEVILKKLKSSKCDLKDVVKHHLKVLNWTENLSLVIAPSVITLYLTSAVMLGVLGFDVVKNKNYAKINYLGAVLLRNFLYHYISESIKSKVNSKIQT